MTRREFLALTAGLAGCARARRAGPGTQRRPFDGPLRVNPRNPRYFTDARGRAIYLTGAHTWPNLVDQGLDDPPKPFDFAAYLDRLTAHHHNFIRLWTWESAVTDIDEGGRRMRYFARPQPWRRTGPGNALDGKPKFDLDQFEPEYFARLRSRVSAAADRGIYVSIMLFEGWGMQHAHGAFEGHPFHPENNVQRVNGDVDGDGTALEIHTLDNPATLRIQEAYIRHVIESVGDLDNVLYEVSNENHPPSTAWQYHVIRFVQAVERGKRHPVGMTFQYEGGSNQTLFESPADWISPNPEGGYRDAPPPADGRKVVLNDTDHLWGIGGNPYWVWKSFLRGHNPLFMDPYDGLTFGAGDPDRWESIRVALGLTRRMADRLDLDAMTPQPDVASSGYCLANTGAAPEFLVYAPEEGAVRIDLRSVPIPLKVEWFEAATLRGFPVDGIEGGDWRQLERPGTGPAVLHLRTSGGAG